eukprot:IDg23075t1
MHAPSTFQSRIGYRARGCSVLPLLVLFCPEGLSYKHPLQDLCPASSSISRMSQGHCSRLRYCPEGLLYSSVLLHPTLLPSLSGTIPDHCSRINYQRFPEG